MATFVAASKNSTTATSGSFTLTLPTGATTGDIVVFAVVTATTGTGIAPAGWLSLRNTDNSTSPGYRVAVLYRILQAGDTSPSFTISAKSSFVGYAFRPGAAKTFFIDTNSNATDTTTGTSITAPSLAATGTDISLLLLGGRAIGNGSTAITTSPPSGWTEDANGDVSTAAGTTAALRQVFTEGCYKLAATGTQTPAAFTTSASSEASATHVLILEGDPKAAAKTLTDNFASQDNTKWQNWSTDVSIDSGRLHINTLAAYSNLAAVSRYDLTGSSVMFELVQTPNQGNGSTQAFLDLAVDANNDLEFLWEAGGATGNIIPRLKQGGSFDNITTAYDATNHRWLRISESGGNISWSTSANGTSWSTLRTIANPFAVTSLSVTLFSGYYATETSPGYALFDNVNIVPADVAVSGTVTVTVDGQLTAAGVSDVLTFSSSSAASRTANVGAAVTATAAVSPAADRTANVGATVGITGSVTAAAVTAAVTGASVPVTAAVTTDATRAAYADVSVAESASTSPGAARTANVDAGAAASATIVPTTSLAAIAAVSVATTATITSAASPLADAPVPITASVTAAAARTAYADASVPVAASITSDATDAEVVASTVATTAAITVDATRTAYVDSSVPITDTVTTDGTRTANIDAAVTTAFGSSPVAARTAYVAAVVQVTDTITAAADSSAHNEVAADAAVATTVVTSSSASKGAYADTNVTETWTTTAAGIRGVVASESTSAAFALTTATTVTRYAQVALASTFVLAVGVDVINPPPGTITAGSRGAAGVRAASANVRPPRGLFDDAVYDESTYDDTVTGGSVASVRRAVPTITAS